MRIFTLTTFCIFQAAARRLIGYWRHRKFCFGADKAFLPMTIDGAMQDDVDVLRKGIVHILPDDEHSRAVLFMDRTKMCEPHASTEQIVSGVLWARSSSSALLAHFLLSLLTLF
jgi:hypothetical protein